MSSTVEKKNYVSKQGYVVYKNITNENLVKKIKRDLEVSPKSCPGYGNDEPDTYKVYRENSSKLYIPIHYGLKHGGSIDKKLPFVPKKINLKFVSGLRDYQKDIVDTYMNYVGNDTVNGGIISVGCGRGKTVMALNIISRIGYKTLILVHKSFLLDQWVERIEQFIPDAKIGLIRGKILDINDKDIVIGMIQSLSNPKKDSEYPVEIFDQFGLVVADECHHLSASKFSRCLMKHTFPRTLGLTATPTRADGLTNVFKYFLGDIIYKDSEIKKSEEEMDLDHIPDAIVDTINYICYDKKYCKEILNYKKRPNTITMDTNISAYLPRTLFIIKILKVLFKENSDRQVFILSSRREHVFTIEEKIIEYGVAGGSVGCFLGGMSETDLNESMKKKIIVATYSMAEEGFDCKTLNTLILATPKKEIEQAVGRILRKNKTERTTIPLIINICDMFSNFVAWNTKRNQYFKKKKYEINYYKYYVDDKISNDNKNMDELDKYNNLNMEKISSIKVENYKREYVSQKFKGKKVGNIDKFLNSNDFDNFGNKNIKYEIDMD